MVNPFGIGDVLFTSGIIREIKTASPENRVSYWCNLRVKELLENNPRLEKIFALSRGDLKKLYGQSPLRAAREFLALAKGIKKERFDALIDFSLDHRYCLLAKVLGIKKRIGFNYKNRGRFLTEKIEIASYDKQHIVDYYLMILEILGIQPQTKELEVFTGQKSDQAASYLFSKNGIQNSDTVIGIAPGAGASWGKDAGLKRWPAIKYAQLCSKILENCNAKIVLLGDASEKPISDVICAAMKNKPIDLTGKLGLGELLSVIKKLRLLITNDGGPLHIAVANKVKTVSIFGPVDEKVYGPYPASENHIVITARINCRPCYRNFKMPPCDQNRQCVYSVDSDNVFQAVRRQL